MTGSLSSVGLHPVLMPLELRGIRAINDPHSSDRVQRIPLGSACPRSCMDTLHCNRSATKSRFPRRLRAIRRRARSAHPCHLSSMRIVFRSLRGWRPWPSALHYECGVAQWNGPVGVVPCRICMLCSAPEYPHSTSRGHLDSHSRTRWVEAAPRQEHQAIGRFAPDRLDDRFRRTNSWFSNCSGIDR